MKRGIPQGICFSSSQDNAVGNNKSYENRELLADVIQESFENLIRKNHQCCDDGEFKEINRFEKARTKVRARLMTMAVFN